MERMNQLNSLTALSSCRANHITKYLECQRKKPGFAIRGLVRGPLLAYNSEVGTTERSSGDKLECVRAVERDSGYINLDNQEEKI